MLAGCAAASLLAAVWSWRHGAMLNYGDAVAHLHIARRVIDSRRPGLSQLGSVWLPLPHLLMIPFVSVYAWWANGLAGLIPSAMAYVAGCAGIYRLARRWLAPAASWIALAFFALNPNLLYMQTTAMTEPLFVCEMIWASVWLVEWRAGNLHCRRAAGTGVVRMDCFIALPWCWQRPCSRAMTDGSWRSLPGWPLGSLWRAAGLGIGRLLDREHDRGRGAGRLVLRITAIVFGDWLDFMRGPYSAKAIEMRTATPGTGPPHPGWHNPWVAMTFFVKAAEMDAAGERWGTWLLVAEPAGSGVGMAHGAQARVLLVVAAVAADSLLCVFGCIRFGADLSTAMVATLLVQHALWLGTAAGLGAGARIPGAGPADRPAGIQACMDKGGRPQWGWA